MTLLLDVSMPIIDATNARKLAPKVVDYPV
jgi:hypothetical protein